VERGRRHTLYSQSTSSSSSCNCSNFSIRAFIYSSAKSWNFSMDISAGPAAGLCDSASFGAGFSDSGERPLKLGLLVEKALLADT
jgi:hypothetical protein